MSSAGKVLERILKKRITKRNGTLCANAMGKIRLNPLAISFIELRTKQWDCLTPTIKDRVNIIIQYILQPEKCPICGNPRFSWKKFCSVDCANIFQNRPKKNPSETHRARMKYERHSVNKACDGKPICWIETKEQITLKQYAARTAKIESKIEEFFCFLDGTIVSNLQYYSIQAIETMKSRQSPDPKYKTFSAYRNRNRSGLSTVHKPKPIPSYKLDIGSVDDYYYLVWKFTDISLRTNKIDPENLRSPDFHIDHIFSIRDGLANKIHPAVIGDAVNLRILDARSNCSKGGKSHISKEELFTLYEQSNGCAVPEFNSTIDMQQYFGKAKDGPVPFGYVRFGAQQRLDPKFETVILEAYELRKQRKTLVECSKMLVAAGMAATPSRVRELFYRIAADNNEIAYFKSVVDRKFKKVI